MGIDPNGNAGKKLDAALAKQAGELVGASKGAKAHPIWTRLDYTPAEANSLA